MTYYIFITKICYSADFFKASYFGLKSFNDDVLYLLGQLIRAKFFQKMLVNKYLAVKIYHLF